MVVDMHIFLRRISGFSFKLFLVPRVLEPRSTSLGLLFRITTIIVDAAAPSFLGMIMLLGQRFGVFEGLDCGMVVVLMLIFMNKGLLASFVLLLDVCVLNGGFDFRVKGCVFIAVDVGTTGAV
jgi:hypothetical protein